MSVFFLLLTRRLNRCLAWSASIYSSFLNSAYLPIINRLVWELSSGALDQNNEETGFPGFSLPWRDVGASSNPKTTIEGTHLFFCLAQFRLRKLLAIMRRKERRESREDEEREREPEKNQERERKKFFSFYFLLRHRWINWWSLFSTIIVFICHEKEPAERLSFGRFSTFRPVSFVIGRWQTRSSHWRIALSHEEKWRARTDVSHVGEQRICHSIWSNKQIISLLFSDLLTKWKCHFRAVP